MSRKLLITLITMTMLLMIGITGYASEDTATKENPANVWEMNTVEMEGGTFAFRLENAYIGNDAYEQLVAMGEESSSFDHTFDGYRLVFLEYYVEVGDGFENGSFNGSYVLGGSLWDENYESMYNYYVLSLYANAGKDYVNVSLSSGESGYVYIVYELPTNVESFVTCIYGSQNYWFSYTLDGKSDDCEDDKDARIAELENEVAELQAQIADLQEQLNAALVLLKNEDVEPTDEDAVLLDDDFLKITYQYAEPNSSFENFYDLHILIENKTDQTLVIYSNECYVNDMSAISNFYSWDLAAGKKTQEPYEINCENVSVSSLEEIKTIEFNFVIRIKDDNDSTHGETTEMMVVTLGE